MTKRILTIDGLFVVPVKVEGRLDGLGVRKKNVTGDMPCWSPMFGRFHVKREWLVR